MKNFILCILKFKTPFMNKNEILDPAPPCLVTSPVSSTLQCYYRYSIITIFFRSNSAVFFFCSLHFVFELAVSFILLIGAATRVEPLASNTVTYFFFAVPEPSGLVGRSSRQVWQSHKFTSRLRCLENTVLKTIYKWYLNRRQDTFDWDYYVLKRT
jgi:hypothetical protein